jgi:nucleoside-diphosphate-sugar epimerase
MSEQAHLLVTGFPGFLASRLLPRLLKRHRGAQASVLVPPDLLPQAKRAIGPLRGLKERLRLYSGDVGDMHFGLGGGEYRTLVAEVTEIYHLASASQPSAAPRHAERVNVDGTRNLLEVAKDSPKLRRLHYLSSAFVCGDRQGVIDESELDLGQRFRSAFEETKYRAELLMRQAQKALPITCYRPALLVGDSRRGEIDRLDGPCYFAIKLALAQPPLPLPLPQDADAPLNVVPWDYVVEALLALAEDERAIGGTFHLVDPNPLGTRRFYELLADLTGRRVQRLPFSRGTAEAMLRAPFVDRWLRPQRAGFQYAYHMAFFRAAETERLLGERRVRCPPLANYLEALISYARDQSRRRQEERVEDTLEA